MTTPLFREDPYLTEAEAEVIALTPEGGIVLDRSLFFPTGGGQPGDSGHLHWSGRSLDIATTVKVKDGPDRIALVPAEPLPLPAAGTRVRQRIDWSRRHRHMRMHTALHLLSAVIPFPVTGGAVAVERGRLDFDMPDIAEDRNSLGRLLHGLVDRDLPVTESWITDEALTTRPDLIKTMSVRPPVGAGQVRLIRIGTGPDQVDLQACGGTHVARTGEIGRVRLGKIEKKGRRNRRIYLHLDD